MDNIIVALQALYGYYFDEFNDLTEFGLIEGLTKDAQMIWDDYSQEEEYDPILFFLFAKQLEELAIAFRNACKEEAIEVFDELSLETGENSMTFFGNKITKSGRKNYKYNSPKLDKLIKEKKGIEGMIKNVQKKLQLDGAEFTLSSSLSISKT